MTGHRSMARKRVVEGAVFEIPICGDRFAYAQALSDPLVGFYEGCFSDAQSVEKVADLSFRLRLWVHRDAFKQWRQIGNAPVAVGADDQWFYIQDALTKSVELYQHGTGLRRPVDAPIGDFEAAAIWDPEHIEERLADEASGRRNLNAAAMLERAQKGLNQRR